MELMGMFNDILGGISSDHKRFLDLLFEQENIIDKLRYQVDRGTNVRCQSNGTLAGLLVYGS